jgi:N-acetylmuramoyl-L-alanine amidase
MAAIRTAESIEARAEQEGIAERGAQLHATAAAIFERLWRAEGHDEDGARAANLYKAAARDLRAPGACAAALRGAWLAGDRAHDASVAYAELYRARARSRSMARPDAGDAGTCERELDDKLTLVAPFRPPPPLLEAIDREAQRDEVIPLELPEAGPSTEGEPPHIVRIDSWPGRDAARVVVVLDRPATYRAGDETTGASAARTFLDLDGVDLSGSTPRDIPQDGIVARVLAEPTSSGSRVSLELEGGAWRRVFHLAEPYRIVVDVARHPPGVRDRRLRDVARVVLDPGHGGKDTGAVGPTGIVEKDVALDIARRVARSLASLGIEALLTRDDDRFIALEERTARANSASADLFVSIHCNASEGHGRRGVETYVLDTTRDEIAARIAARENATTQAATAEIASLLSSMRLADQAQRSLHFARLLDRSAVSTLRMKYRQIVDGGVHVAGFYVLVGARMPSVLFESSYVSNPLEEERLGTDAYRQALADSLANAIQAYRLGR